MKVLDIAAKDVLQAFRSLFAIAFMFMVPVLVTGMFYLMFGGRGSADNGGFELPRTTVQVVNLDAGSLPLGADFVAMLPAEMAQSNSLQSGSVVSMGEVLVQMLQMESLAELVEVYPAEDAASARAAVDAQRAGVAIIIPENLTAALVDPQERATVELYQDPTLTLGPGIVKSVVSQFLDGLSGSKVAIGVTVAQLSAAGVQPDEAQVQALVAQYIGTAAAQDSLLLDVRSLGGKAEPSNGTVDVVSLIMAGMMIFYTFYTGAGSAQSILTEEEKGTLPRLFTTPTTQATILAGKFLAVGLIIIVQIVVLLTFASLVFGIAWGQPLAVGLIALGTTAAASTFGIFLISLVRNSRQVGVIYGAVITTTGMMGMMPIFTMNAPNAAKATDLISMLAPQGWALRGLQSAMNSAATGEVLLSTAVLLAWSAAFFVLGVVRFRKRYR